MDVRTYGCAVNRADSEAIAGLLESEGLSCEDIVVVNTCTVKTPTENKILRHLRKLDDEGARVIVAGCIPAARPGIADEFPSFSFIGTDPSDVIEAAKSLLGGERLVRIKKGGLGLFDDCKRENANIGIIQIASGCLGSCRYCQTRLARGSLRSYPKKDIVSQAKRFIKEGAGEIWLTAQDTGAYGADMGRGLSDLILSVAQLDGDFRIRVGMMNPNHAVRMIDEIIFAFEHPKVYKFAHIPVQSGDDGVLNDMGRQYSVCDFKNIAGEFRKIGAAISTDFIVGYPSEDVDAFKRSLSLLDDVKPDVVNITRYWARPGTDSVSLRGHAGSETKRRSRLMAAAFRKIGLSQNQRWVGSRSRAYAASSNPDGTVTARNESYRPIVVPKAATGWMDVEVTDCTYYDLRGRVV